MRIEQFISGEAVDLLFEALLLVGPDGSIVDANDVALRLYGYGRPDLLTCEASDLIVSGERDNVETHCRRDGTHFPAEVHSIPVGSNGDSATLLLVRDISERVRAEDELRASEAKHSSMIRNISDVIGIMGADGFMKYKSPNIEKWFGWQPEDLVGTNGWLTVHPDDVDRLQREFYSLLQVANATTTVEYRYLCKDGSYKWIELTATNLVDDPVIGGVLLNYRDISERRKIEELGRELSSVIDVIGRVSEMRDPYTAGHQRRVSELASAVAGALGISDAQREDIRVAGLIHDIGKMAVPAELLAKSSRLSSIEFTLIANHAEAGYNIISSAHMPGTIAELVYQHHERCDGSGYPRGLHADELLEGAKVLMVADVVEAMTSHRPYRPALGLDRALDEIEHGAGSIYDPVVAESCIRLFRDEEFAFSEA